MNRRNAMVTFATANVMIAQNAAKERMKNDLSLSVTTYNLHHRCSGREVVNKAMNAQQEMKLLNYMQRIAQAMELIAESYKRPDVLEYSAKCATEELQHVGYDDAQLGREK